MFIYLIFESVELSTQANFRGVLLRLTVLVERSRWYIGDSTEPIYIWQRGFVRASRVLYLRMYVPRWSIGQDSDTGRQVRHGDRSRSVPHVSSWFAMTHPPYCTLFHFSDPGICVPMYDLRTQGQYWLRNAITRCDVCLYVMLV